MSDKRDALEQSLLREDVVGYYLSRKTEALEKEFGQDVSRMVGFEQNNSHHCYDLWEHTLRTIEGIEKDDLTLEQFTKLRVAAFFHDIGKPDVSMINEKTGQQVFYGHPKRSFEVAKPILEKLGYNSQEIQQLGFFIKHHDDFISYKTKLESFMRNHLFIREINELTVAEKIIENKFDFEAMGYSLEQIRVICYILAHKERINFRVKNGCISVNMDEVKSKMNSGSYNSNYDASIEDYQMLLKLCKADAKAQQEVVIQNGKVVGSKIGKLDNLTKIESVVAKSYSIAKARIK